MVYSGYGSDAGARSYSSYPSLSEISTNEMETILNAATQRVQDDTAKDDWDSSDAQWELVNMAADVLGGEYAVPRVSRIDRPSDRMRELEKMYLQLIKTINGAPSTEDNPSIITIESSYLSYPLNEDAEDYESLL
jgi:hypothetical protein